MQECTAVSEPGPREEYEARSVQRERGTVRRTKIKNKLEKM
jgi:hypothetical protein